MGFFIHSTSDGHVTATEYHSYTDANIAPGLALKMSEGKLVKCSGTDIPSYIAAAKRAEGDGGNDLPVVRISADTVYKTEAKEALTGICVGSKLTISSDGLGVTATTEGGCAELVSAEGTASGSAVYVRFVAPDPEEPEEPEDDGEDDDTDGED